MAAGSFWRAAATLFLGMAYLMAGDPERADVLFENQVTEARAVGGMIGACIALAERSLLAITRGSLGSGRTVPGRSPVGGPSGQSRRLPARGDHACCGRPAGTA
jgi:hypothetical protein